MNFYSGNRVFIRIFLSLDNFVVMFLKCGFMFTTDGACGYFLTVNKFILNSKINIKLNFNIFFKEAVDMLFISNDYCLDDYLLSD